MPYQHVRPTPVVALSPTKAAQPLASVKRIAAAIRSGEFAAIASEQKLGSPRARCGIGSDLSSNNNNGEQPCRLTTH